MNSIDSDFTRAYTPAEAERGKFVVLDTSTITDYPSTGYGKYAILVHQTNPSNLILSSGNVTVSSVYVTNDIVVDHIIDPIVVEPFSFPISSYILSDLTIGTINDTIVVDSITDTVITQEKLPTGSVLVCSVSLISGTSAVFSFNPVITLVELYNNSSHKIYFSFNTSETYASVTNRGMILDGESYYAIEKNTDILTITSPSGSDVRIFGHRR